MFFVHKKYSANRCLFWLVGMVDGAILLRTHQIDKFGTYFPKSIFSLQLFHITASSSSCLRILQQCGQHNPMHNKSIYVGIDDFLPIKKGKDYMSVVVDQMTHTYLLLC